MHPLLRYTLDLFESRPDAPEPPASAGHNWVHPQATRQVRLDGVMAKKARPWLLDSLSKRWANRTLKSCSPWSSAKRGALTGVLPSKRQT